MRQRSFRPVTIAEVARHAGVSQATVSRVINGNATVAAELQARVRRAVQELGYQPDRAARRLRSNASQVLGLIVSDIQNPYFTAVVRGVEDAAYAQGMAVLLCNSDGDPDKQASYIQVLRAERAAGLIVAPTSIRDGPMLIEVRANGTPVVLLDRQIEGAAFDSVVVDNVHGAEMATTHLLALGRRRVALIAGALDTTTGRDRLRGYLQALEARGVRSDPQLIKEGDFKYDAGYTLTRALLEQSPRPDALFVANNLMTLGALKALREAGVRVPDDIALVGFDDFPWASELQPPLTTVAQPTYELGRTAAQQLFERLREPDAPARTHVLQTRLVVRASCGARL